MLLMSHTAMGILISAVTSNPILGSAISFMSHYVLDTVPHESKEELFYVPPHRDEWSDEIKNKLHNRKKTSVIDLLFSILLIAVYVFYSNLLNLTQITMLLTVIFFSILPDILTIIYLRYPVKVLSKHYDLHYKIHKIIPFQMSYITAVSYQMVFAAGLVWLAIFTG